MDVLTIASLYDDSGLQRVRIMMWICHEGWLMSDLTVSFSRSVLSPSWVQVFFILIEGVLSPSWIQVSFILIKGVCLGQGEFYGL